MIRYTCQRDMLPLIEAALAAHGCQIALPVHHQSNGAGIMVMTRGLTSVVLLEQPDRATLDIAIWGMGLPAIAKLLESLPIASLPAMVARKAA